jgi:hypothetical protein
MGGQGHGPHKARVQLPLSGGVSVRQGRINKQCIWRGCHTMVQIVTPDKTFKSGVIRNFQNVVDDANAQGEGYSQLQNLMYKRVSGVATATNL